MQAIATKCGFLTSSVLMLLSLCGVARADSRSAVLVECEAFEKTGGWVVDQQFMDQMGSPFLLAHGLGVPVADAVTSVELPAAGTYKVWVRTRDWVAPWKAPGAPGRFQVLIDGKPLAATFGTQGADWHWQDGGSTTVANRRIGVALHDLTGFEGRCDAIVFAADASFSPPNGDPEMAAFRRKTLDIPDKPEDGGAFDLVVVGGGIAGTCATLSASRLGLTAALVQDRPVLGGNNSSEIRVWLQGARNAPPYERLGDVVGELEQKRTAHYGADNTAELYEDDRKISLVREEKNAKLLLGWRVNHVETEGGRIVAVTAQETTSGRRIRIRGRWFADCTGDGCIGAMAGADHEMTVPGHLGQSNLWNVVETDRPQSFPRCEWALDLSDKPFPGRSKEKPDVTKLGGWYWESGFDRNPLAESEYIRDWNLRAMYGAWDAMKNVDKVLPNHKLNWAAFISGKRESRRLLGDVVLTKDDLVSNKAYPDGCVPTGWKIDLHLPDKRYEPGFEGDAFIAKADFGTYQMPYWIPYRCLYSRNVPNLFMAGRDISVTHEALGAVRVMRTGGVMGEVVGMAASLCKKHDCDPRCVYEKQLDALKELMRRGVGKASPDTKGSSASSPPFRHAFFVMENGVKDEKHPTAESQARVVKELGLDGMSVETGLDGIPERLAALDREGLSLFAIYTPAWLDGDKPKYDPKLPEVIKQLKGRPTVLWLTLQSVAHKPSTEEADAGAVEIVREVADLARESGIRIVLYPHAFFWMERAGDAVRIARKVDRKNVGMTFNLCHWLRFERPETLEARLQTAKPYLMHVTINGTEESGDNWERLIQPLGSGAYDVSRVLKALKKLGYGGPVGLQCYGVKGDKYDNLKRSMAAWRAMVADVKPD